MLAVLLHNGVSLGLEGRGQLAVLNCERLTFDEQVLGDLESHQAGGTSGFGDFLEEGVADLWVAAKFAVELEVALCEVDRGQQLVHKGDKGLGIRDHNGHEAHFGRVTVDHQLLDDGHT